MRFTGHGSLAIFLAGANRSHNLVFNLLFFFFFHFVFFGEQESGSSTIMIYYILSIASDLMLDMN